MDFDDRFDLDEFIKHFQDLNLLKSHEDALELIKRTTKTTRGGNAFSFKPTHIWIGSSSSDHFHCGFDCDIDPVGLDPQKVHATDPSERELSSSFWIRFKTAGRKFQFRVFCAGQSVAALRPLEAELPFSEVVRGGVELRTKRDGERVCAYLTIRARRPPRAIVRLVPVIPGRRPIYDRLATEADFFHPSPCLNEAESGPISPLGSDHAIIKIGLWLTYKFSFHITIRQYKLLWQCMIRLRLMQLEPDLRASLTVSRPPSIDSSWPEGFSSFPIRYLVEALVSNGTVKEPELASLNKALRRYPHSWPPMLEGLFKKSRMRHIAEDVKDVASRIGVGRSLPPYYLRVRKCLVTPNRCLLLPPQLETSNSMLRAFTDFQDRFLRVQFVDEDIGALQIKAEILKIDEAVDSKMGIFARLRRGIRFGLYIASRHYVFLCFGESQAKERGCWMISETENFTVKAVLDWIGDLSEEINVAKHAARQGLVLSTSRPVDLDDLQIKVEYDIPDITVTTSGRTYMFTDGVGRCRQELIDYCSSTLERNLKGAASSAMQVRIGGGSKGVLCAVPDDMIEANLVQVRKSMVKFKSSSKTTLNVLKFSSYGIAYLNRQGILLLEELGVSFEVLLQLFLDEKARIEGLGQHIGDTYVANLTKFPLVRAISSGFTEDPLVQNIIRVLKCRLLSDLKWKARIPVEKGAYLMGVADETRTLQVGEVFCQIDGPQGFEVVTGPCTIYRNPCLHPGDVRRVQAVNNPSLSYLKNVVVFSTYGTRDLPNMMGGGDLDGDHYTLLWDERLIISRECEPMDYTPPPRKIYPRPITVNETKEFWLEYIKNDMLGMICNAHLALADTYSPSYEGCLFLAKLASQAVDYSKTGVPVDRTSYTRSGSYPDFMGKNEVTNLDISDEAWWSPFEFLETQPIRTHQSKKVLGHMFRSIDPDPVFKPVEEDLEWDPPFPTQVPERWEEYLEETAALKIRYDFELDGLLRTHSISEAECVAGILLHSKKRRIRAERDYGLRETVRDIYNEIVSSFKEQAQAYLTSHPVTKDPENDRRAWALACYKVTYDKSFSHYTDAYSFQSLETLTDDDSDDGSEDLEQPKPEKHLSFPWVFHEELLDIA